MRSSMGGYIRTKLFTSLCLQYISKLKDDSRALPVLTNSESINLKDFGPMASTLRQEFVARLLAREHAATKIKDLAS